MVNGYTFGGAFTPLCLRFCHCADETIFDLRSKLRILPGGIVAWN
jgi:hypothetical protein